ncbi:DUF2790 domain-containing protein [Pseudomonas sp. PSKL.D1]|uniref:DUF2790 domain-containing protein n=1 Tax=Pseudomonas sp. PSKL.D1 TaxID=3029060 RepID=UPI002380E9BE|nr:DUF2790 domain-containing protein [Pseudomonas sp. PSKL.D1]WDY57921.1 DUF2790 domain-containing protein [Pseudomonas sp. PSKL.D1]
MTLRKAFALTVATLTLGASAGAFAQSTEATPYRYGMNLDIAKVISVDSPSSAQGQVNTATLTYRDSNGEVRRVSYSQPNTSLANQN